MVKSPTAGSDPIAVVVAHTPLRHAMRVGGDGELIGVASRMRAAKPIAIAPVAAKIC